MKSKSNSGNYSVESVSQFAKRNYRTYVTHYESRNLKPMPFEEFIKNYAI
jgi:hypothetical protein